MLWRAAEICLNSADAIEAAAHQHMTMLVRTGMPAYRSKGAVMDIKRGRMPGPTLLAAVVMLMTTNAMAQTTMDEVVQALKPTGMKNSLKQKIEMIAGQEAGSRDRKPRVDVTIEFKFNSDRPTAVGQQHLKTVAVLLKDLGLLDLRYVLAGHADARGGLAYNYLLSERRARTVQRYLVRAAGMDPTRLHAVGLGKSQPLDPADPASDRNRRVQITSIKD